MMTKQALVPTAALLLVILGGLVLLLSLAPRDWHGKADDQEGGVQAQPKEDEIGWGEPVRGLRLGINILDSKFWDIDTLLPGQSIQAGFWLENVSGDTIRVGQYCSIVVRAQRREGELLEDVPEAEKQKDDPLFHVALLFQDEIKAGERVGISSGFCHEINKGFLRVGNSRYGPLLAGQYVLSGNVNLTVKGEGNAQGEEIELTSGTTSVGVRDIDWGPAHDGVQIALAEYRYRSVEPDMPVVALVCRNSGDKHLQWSTGIDLVCWATVTKANGTTEHLLCGIGIPEGSMGFDLKPGEIQLQAHDFRWRYITDRRSGEYTFSLGTSFYFGDRRSPIYKTNSLKLKLGD